MGREMRRRCWQVDMCEHFQASHSWYRQSEYSYIKQKHLAVSYWNPKLKYQRSSQDRDMVFPLFSEKNFQSLPFLLSLFPFSPQYPQFFFRRAWITVYQFHRYLVPGTNTAKPADGDDVSLHSHCCNLTYKSKFRSFHKRTILTKWPPGSSKLVPICG
jgi:hypothetical protein